jgi:hypothetical protein
MFVSSNGFYVPGVAPVEFKYGEPIEVRAVKMTSVITQLPYEYYSLPFCKPKNRTIYKSENLGELWNLYFPMKTLSLRLIIDGNIVK